mgnify:CR=1 FL=1
MKEDLRQLYMRKKNTINYSLDNVAGIEGKNDSGDFSIRIPPMAFPNYQSSQYALFTLNSVYVLEKTEALADRLSNNVNFDISAFYVEISGIGINSVVATLPGTTARPSGVSFFIVNETSMADLGNSNQYSRNAGGLYHGESVVCSNPTGAVINVKIRDASTGLLVPDNANLISVVNFSIELLDLD